MNRKKYIIAGLLVALVVIGLFLWSKKTNKTVNLLKPTNLVAANLQFVDQLHQSQDDSIRFFTGSALAELDLKDDTLSESKLLTKDLPFEGVKSVSEGSSILAVKAYYNPSDSLLAFNLSPGKQLVAGDNWFLVDKDTTKISPLANFTDKQVSDVIIDGSDIYYLSVGEQNKLALAKISNGLGKNEVLADSVDASVFVGSYKGSLAMRDLGGNLYNFRPGAGVSKIGEQISEVAFDTNTGHIVTSAQIQDVANDEGGSVASNKGELHLTIRDISGGGNQQTNLKGSVFFVSNGVVVALNSLRQPTALSYYVLKTAKTGAIVIDQGVSNVLDQIKSITVMKSDLSKIAVFTNFNHLLIYQIPGRAAPKDYTLPSIKDNLGLYGFNYDIGKNIATIYYSRGGKAIIEGSISELKNSCRCDVNQIDKVWKPIATSPGL